MKILNLFIILLVCTNISCFHEKDSKGVDKLQLVYSKFENIFISVKKMPRISLSNQLSQLHALQSELIDINVSKCLKPAKKELGNAINNFSRGVALFMNRDEKRADYYFLSAAEHLEEYQKIFLSCRKPTTASLATKSPAKQIPPKSRFTDNGNGTVTDTRTGLMWTKDANPFGGLKWDDAMARCRYYSISGIGGWRLANKDELVALYHAMKGEHPFTGVQSSYYWSSTTYAHHTDFAWVVSMNNGTVTRANKTHTVHGWPVRASQSLSQQQQEATLPIPPPPAVPKPEDTKAEKERKQQEEAARLAEERRKADEAARKPKPSDTRTEPDMGITGEAHAQRFTDIGDGTVTDNVTNLMWTKDANPIGQRNWNNAMSMCRSFSINGIGGWRLPSKDELVALYDVMQGGHPFAGVQSSFYWSSTPHSRHTDSAMVVYMVHGGAMIDTIKTNAGHVWCVRTAQ